MNWSTKLLAKAARRENPVAVGRASSTVAVQGPEHKRHPAMAGINVSPVHGHHCICSRCQPRQRRPEHRQAA
jgi:hypothetical protein